MNDVTKLWNTDQKLYVWAINSSEIFNKSFHLGVDLNNYDLILENKEELETACEDPEYSDLLSNKANQLFAF